MASKLALISRHVVLYKYFLSRVNHPTYAVILINEEVIYDVVLVAQDRAVEEVVMEYVDWNPIDLEHSYISPGMIDFNIRRKREWESLESLTKAAVSGGVTLCVEERTMQECDQPESGALYCDLGYTAVVEPSEILAIRPEDYSETLGLKGYLTPPNDTTGAIHDLEQWFQVANRLKLPLLLDSCMAETKVLYTSSPCRLLTLEQRLGSESIPEVFGGAFAEDSVEESLQDSDEEREPVTCLTKVRKSGDESRRRTTKAPDLAFSPSGRRHIPLRKQTMANILDVRSNSYKDIHSALEDEIKKSADKLESLVSAEMAAYRGVGKTNFPKAKSMSIISIEEKPHPHPRPGLKKRPTPLNLTSPTPSPIPATVYLQQLAYYPHNLECKGVNKIIKALRTTPCKVHVANLAAAAAVATLHKAKSEGFEVTCETCPHFLYFTDQSIKDGDTRLKCFPPIRNKSNCNFLWELVTMNSVDTICSQHIPIPQPYKSPNFRTALPGVNGLGYTLQVLWTLLKRPFTDLGSFEHYLIRLARWTAFNPAKILDIPNRGSIEKGFRADLVIWSPLEQVTVRETYSAQTSQCAYLNTSLYGKIEKVLIRGQLAFSNGTFYPIGRVIRRGDLAKSSLA